ncbi:outer membrane lipoprotein carrier protein LolA [Acetobacter sp. TBRC 12305]|uniref:Outer membrane lipoprotein carrier protein LolA n=1 Tax=Acetobacter garciniae TaxID=2817435 RepID=A0A939HN78_9PROT|nr:LolA-related protein [Acetobacter garciniae]MBO1324794.1 outer membrane lipoprotein carrier protein LolA [Acetobacter garciniae]MBX0344485.1 outer membrane lipoprotein carrier protein LolA [Acetobacter garciniae]
MKLRPVMLPLCLSVLFFPLLCGPARAQDLADAIVTGLGQVHQRQNVFHEERVIGALTQKLESAGNLSYRAPGHLEKLTLTPRREDLVIDGDMVTIARGTAAPQTLDASREPALQLLVDTLRAPLDGDVERLKRAYHLHASGDLGGGWTLEMTPANDDVAKQVRTVTFTGRNNAILGLRIVQANGDTQSLTITP